MTLLQSGLAKSLAEAYTIDNSLRWNAPDDPELSRTPGSAGSQTIFTLSTWFKRSELGTSQRITEVYVDGGNFSYLAFDTSDRLNFTDYSGSYPYNYITTQVFRDVGAWMHLVVRVDTTDGTPGDRIRIYVNGSEVTAFGTETNPSDSLATDWNTTNEMTIGCRSTTAASGDERDHFEGYLAEFYWIDGTALLPSSFGELDSDTNQWIPIDASGLTFGTNGFYQKYNSTELADSFTDSSGGIFQGSDFAAVTSSMTFSVGNVGMIIDGNTSASSGCIPTSSQTVSAQDVTFDCGSGVTKIFTHAEFILSNTYNDGVWKWQGSNDDVSYSDIGSGTFTVQGATSEGPPIDITGGLSSNTTAYRYYRWQGVSGTTTASNYWTEIVNLKTAPPGTGFHTITDNGDVKNVRGAGDFQFDYLVVAGGAGGGGGAAGSGGGGGAGGLRSGTTSLMVDTPYVVTIGTGGDGAPVSTSGDAGLNSSVGHISATGGGKGGYSSSAQAGTGGSGGGGGNGNNPQSGAAGNAGSYSPVEGYAGGNQAGSSNNWGGGGGGGSSAVGTNGGTNVGGDGGDGTSSSITGAAVDYAGGGGGGAWNSGSSGSTGGDGGGGAGGQGASVAGSNATGYGSGGGGAGQDGTGGDGSDGIVIIRYKSATNLATGGTITTDGDYKVHSFTTSGTLTPTTRNVTQGTSAIEFDGTGDYLTVPDSPDWALGTGDFTVEYWLNHQSVATGNSAIAFSPADDYRQLFGYVDAGDGLFKLYLSSSGGGWDIASGVSMGTAALGEWKHYAIVRSGTSFYTFQDGTQISTFTSSSSMYSANTDALSIGRYGGGNELDGYMDEIRISNSARYTSAFTPPTTQFTADANTLLLIHSDYTGGLGADSSGNYNNFTATNLVATDQMVDTPTNNFATLNPLVKPYGTNTYSEGNLVTTANINYNIYQATIPVSSGKWYAEYLVGDTDTFSGIMDAGQTPAGFATYHTNTSAKFIFYNNNNGNKIIDGTASTYDTGTTAAVGDIIGIALDLDSGTQTIEFYLNGSTKGSIDISGGCLTASSLVIGGESYQADPERWNFGQDSSFAGNKTAQGNQDSNEVGDFYYTPPTDFLALCTNNLPDPDIKLPGDYFNTVLYTGSGSSQSVTTGLQPDFCWVKNRGRITGYSIVDVVRGDGQVIDTDVTTAEVDQASAGAQSISSTSFTVDGTHDDWNKASDTYVSWNWKAGGAPTTDNLVAAGGTPTAGSVKIDGVNLGSALAGSIAATRLSANTTSGMSIVQYTGTGSAATIAHGLGVKPALMIFKKTNGTDDWAVWQKDLHGDSTLNALKMTGASYVSSSTWWNSTDPTTSVINVGTNGATGAANEFICYVFAEIPGFSKVGNYVVNTSSASTNNGNFLYTGFKPAFFLNKMSDGPDGGGSWFLYDNKRSVYNLTGNYLVPDYDYAENASSEGWDFLSNGIKLRADFSANTTIYMAFAESPFKYSNAR